MEMNEIEIVNAEFEKEDVEKNKGMAVLAYFSWLVIIPFIRVRKTSKFARFHINQGLVLTIVDTVYELLSMAIVKIVMNISTRMGLLVETTLDLCSIVFLILFIMGVVNAAKGKAKELPTFGKIRILK